MSVDPMYVEIGRRVRELREERGVTQYELAERIGMSRPAIQMIERGSQRIHLDTLVAISHALDTEVGYLIGLT